MYDIVQQFPKGLLYATCKYTLQYNELLISSALPLSYMFSALSTLQYTRIVHFTLPYRRSHITLQLEESSRFFYF